MDSAVSDPQQQPQEGGKGCLEDKPLGTCSCAEFFEHHKTRASHQIVSTSKQHIFSDVLFRWPRRVVVYDHATDGYLEYHSRPHRKNRHLEFHPKDPVSGIQMESKLPQLLKIDWQNISWHVAIFFCLGSICWIVNGQYALMQSNTPYVVNAIGYSGFAGGMLFWIGAYLAVVEALNTNKNLYYGAEIEKIANAVDKKLHAFHHVRVHNTT